MILSPVFSQDGRNALPQNRHRVCVDFIELLVDLAAVVRVTGQQMAPLPWFMPHLTLIAELGVREG